LGGIGPWPPGRRRRRTGLVRAAGALLLGPGKGRAFDLGPAPVQPRLRSCRRRVPFQAQSVRQRLRSSASAFGQQLLDLYSTCPQLLASATVTDRECRLALASTFVPVNGHRDLGPLQDSAAAACLSDANLRQVQNFSAESERKRSSAPNGVRHLLRSHGGEADSSSPEFHNERRKPREYS